MYMYVLLSQAIVSAINMCTKETTNNKTARIVRYVIEIVPDVVFWKMQYIAKQVRIEI